MRVNVPFGVRTTVLLDASGVTFNENGGIARFYREVLWRVLRLDQSIRFVVLARTDGHSWLPRHRRVKVVTDLRLRRARALKFVDAALRLFTLCRLRLAGPSIYQLCYYQVPRLSSLPIVTAVYDLIDLNTAPGLSGNGDSFTERIVASVRSAARVVAISKATKHDIVRITGVRPEAIVVCAPGVGREFRLRACFDKSDYSPAQYEGLKPYVLFVGARYTYKNFDLLLRSWIRLRLERDIHLRLVCIGGMDQLENEQVQRLTSAGLQNDVALLGNVSDSDLRAAYSAASVLVLPSLWEGFGLPLLEALACGCPVVASDIAPFREVAGDAAIYFDPRCEESLMDAITASLRPEVARALLIAAPERVTSYDWNSAAKGLVDVYRDLTDIKCPLVNRLPR